jgi:hypothetical protein
LLALNWAVCDKSKDYLYDTQFTVLTTIPWPTCSQQQNSTPLGIDGLNHIPQTYSDNRETISVESVQAICNFILPKAYIESLAVNPDIVPAFEEDIQDDYIIDWVKAQSMGPVIKPFMEYVREGRKPKATDVGPTPLLRQLSHLRLVDDVLYRVKTRRDN